MKTKSKDKNGIFKFDGKYRIFAKYDIGTGDYIRMPDGAINPTFDDYYLLTYAKDEVHHSYDDIFVLYIFSLKRGNRVLEKLQDIKSDIVVDLDETDSEIIISFKESDMDVVNSVVRLITSGADISPTDIRNLPGGVYDIPDKRLEEFTAISRKINIPISRYKKLYLEFIESKTTSKNNALHCFEVSNIPAKNFIYKNGWWDDLLKYMENYKV